MIPGPLTIRRTDAHAYVAMVRVWNHTVQVKKSVS